MGKCDESPSGELLKAFGEFNRGDWFDCHETLEELWTGSVGEIRDFFQGTLQIAVALHHWRNGNFKGAILLLEGGAGYLRRVGRVCQRIDVAHLVASTDKFREALQDIGPDRMKELDSDLVPRMRLSGVRTIQGEVMRIVLIVVIACLCAIAHAQADGGIKKEAKEIGHHIKQLGKETGHAIKEGAKDVGRDFKAVGKETGREARKTGRSLGDRFKDAGSDVRDAFVRMGRSIRSFFTGD
jgi:uncharacterized protein